MTKRVTSYIMTADPYSVSDMQQIEMIKKTVSANNQLVMQDYKWACARAAYRGDPMPELPKQYRVRLMARGPRRKFAIADGKNKAAYDSSLPLRYATRFDVYIHARY